MQTEQSVLRISIIATFLIAALGIGIGLWIGSFSIMFDGVYSLTDAIMTVVALWVSKLITSSLGERTQERLVRHFTMGFWHLEPIVLALSGFILMGTALYAFLGAVNSLMTGGRELNFDKAIIFAAVSMVTALAMAAFDRRANRRINSNFIEMDAKAWLISAGMTGALLIAFIFGWAIQGTSLQWMAPYVDPAVLAVVCLFVLPIPVPTIRQALADVLLVTPAELKAHVDEVAARVVALHGFRGYRAYVARVGRGRQIELYFIVPQGEAPRPLEHWDRLRDQIGEMIGDAGPDRWLTIAFTTDVEWAE